MTSMRNIVSPVLGIFLLGSTATLRAQATPFYQGKTVKIIVGFTSGGFYDRWSRLLARYVPKYIPGNPEMIVQNMPGAGGLIAANHVYGVAKPDGLTLGMLSHGVYLDQLVGHHPACRRWSPIHVALAANDGVIGLVEKGMDLAMIAGGSKTTHMIMGGKPYKS